jgi:hypothetical protein
VTADLAEKSSSKIVSSPIMGSIGIRVVVLPRKDEFPDQSAPILDQTADEPDLDDGPSPVGSYLERPKGGRLPIVFLVNGQRQDSLDNAFIIKPLGFKYLRKRMMIIVDVDTLEPDPLNEMMQSNRQSFFKGAVWAAVMARLTATLKGDPDLKRFEEEAEAQITELQAGDEKVKEALDSLIDSHHSEADHISPGDGGVPGIEQGGQLNKDAKSPIKVVSLATQDKGLAATAPVIRTRPRVTTLRLSPGEKRQVTIESDPIDQWKDLSEFSFRVDPVVPDLVVTDVRTDKGVTFDISHPDNLDASEYPLRTSLHAFAKFAGREELRHVVVGIKIAPTQPKPEPVLLDDPTFIRVVSRQPVKLMLDKADSHARLRWNGKDGLFTQGWTFSVRCDTPGYEGVKAAFSEPKNGLFSIALSCANGIENTVIKLTVFAHGPNGKQLSAIFDAVFARPVTLPVNEPRKIDVVGPAGVSRRPPYSLRYVEERNWDNGTCWQGQNWTEDDVACYQEPTEKQPLTLLINTDFKPLQDFRKALIAKKLSESEIKNRTIKYSSHVGYHLYQMYKAAKEREEKGGENAATNVAFQRQEIYRVAMTLLKIMQVTR